MRPISSPRSHFERVSLWNPFSFQASALLLTPPPPPPVLVVLVGVVGVLLQLFVFLLYGLFYATTSEEEQFFFLAYPKIGIPLDLFSVTLTADFPTTPK